MKTLFLVALTALSGAIAAPLNKRARVTITHEVVEYVHVTSTVWVKGPVVHAATTTTVPAYYTPAPKPANKNQYKPKPAKKKPTKNVAPPKYTPPPSSPPSPPAVHTPTPPSPPAPVYTPPAPVYTPPAPVTQPAPQPAPLVPEPEAQAPSYNQPSPERVESGGESEEIEGEATFYAPGMGACGKESTSEELIAAIGTDLYSKTIINGNPNNNPVCGKKIACYIGNSKPVVVTVVDRCPKCTDNDLDLSPAAFAAAGGVEANGREKIRWKWVS